MDIALPFLILLWVLGYFLGAYLAYHLLDYLKNKPLGQQTLLDILYAQMFEYWVLSYFGFLTIFSLIEITPVPWIVAMVIGWSTTYIAISAHISIIISGSVKLILIVKQEMLESIADDTIQTILRQVRCV